MLLPQHIDQRPQILDLQPVHLLPVHVRRARNLYYSVRCATTCFPGRQSGLELLQFLFFLLERRHEFFGLGHDVGRVGLENVRQRAELGLPLLQQLIGPFARLRFDPAHARGHATLGDELEKPDLSGVAAVGPAAELLAERIDFDDADFLPVLVAEEGQRAFLHRFGDPHDLGLHRRVGSDPLVDDGLHLLQLAGSHRCEMREVEAEAVGRHQGAVLLDVRPQHLLHAVLRDVLGPHVKQYGSLVAPNRLRFDFAHFAPVRPGQLEEVEAIVNERVRTDAPVQTKIMGISEAMQEGALAFFGDKYGEEVRVVEINAFSKELCGGTHCRHTGEIGLFKLVSEGGVAAGVRRIEAQTGEGAYELLKQRETELRALADILKTNTADVVTKAKKLVTTLKEKEEELEKLKARLASGETGGGGGEARMVAGVPVYIQRVDGLEMNDLRALADTVREKLKSGIVALGSVKDDKASLLVAVTKDLAARFPAGELIKPLAAEIGGTGGGRPEMAQAGGKQIDRLDAALAQAVTVVERKARG